MTKLRLVAVAAGAFVAGIAFVLACSDDAPGTFDAGRLADAADCSGCEPRIEAARIYRVSDRNLNDLGGSMVRGGVRCKPGDILLGGGCWIYPVGQPYEGTTDPNTGGVNPLLISGPFRTIDVNGIETGREERWSCAYSNTAARTDLVVDATAVCFKLTAP